MSRELVPSILPFFPPPFFPTEGLRFLYVDTALPLSLIARNR